MLSRFLAAEFGLVGKTNLESAQADEIVDAVSDLQTAMIKVAFGKDEKGIQNVLDNVYPAGLVSTNKFLTLIPCEIQANLEKMLVSRGGQFYVGNNMSWADLAVFQFASDGIGGKPPKVKISE